MFDLKSSYQAIKFREKATIYQFLFELNLQVSSEDEDSHGLLFHGFVPDQDYQPSQAKKVKLDDTSEDLLMDVSARIVQPEETVRSVSIQLERVQVIKTANHNHYIASKVSTKYENVISFADLHM